jgi:hypothetical protein
MAFKSPATISLAFAAALAGSVTIAAQLRSPVPRAPASNGGVVYDPTTNAYWLADANLAASQTFGVSGISPNGSMSYATAKSWVAAMNRARYLNHHDWMLPTAPFQDPSCGAKGPGGASFGGLCQGNALGGLYYVNLGTKFPRNPAAYTGATIGPVKHLQLAYYWTQTVGGVNQTGRQVFSVNNLPTAGSSQPVGDVTEVNDAYYYALPMVPAADGPIDKRPPNCKGAAVELYTAGSAKGLAVYDCKTGISWLADANYAATYEQGFTGTVTITYPRPLHAPPKKFSVQTPEIVDGAMLYDTANQWTGKLGRAKYAGSPNWVLPDSPATLKTFFTDLGLAPGDRRLMRTASTGSFRNLQPFFYWATCTPVAGAQGSGVSACANGGYAPPGARGGQMAFDFTFGYGLLSTDLTSFHYFATAYYPAPTPPRPSPPPHSQPATCPPGWKCPKPS